MKRETLSIMPMWVYPKMNTYTNMFDVFTEPKMQSWASCSWDAQIKHVTEARAPKPLLGVGVGKRGQLLLPGAPGGGWGAGTLRTHPQGTGKRRGWPLGEAAGQGEPCALWKHARSKAVKWEQDLKSGMASWRFAWSPEVFLFLYQEQEPGTIKAKDKSWKLLKSPCTVYAQKCINNLHHWILKYRSFPNLYLG